MAPWRAGLHEGLPFLRGMPCPDAGLALSIAPRRAATRPRRESGLELGLGRVPLNEQRTTRRRLQRAHDRTKPKGFRAQGSKRPAQKVALPHYATPPQHAAAASGKHTTRDDAEHTLRPLCEGVARSETRAETMAGCGLGGRTVFGYPTNNPTN